MTAKVQDTGSMSLRELELADWRRRVAELYAAVRAAPPRDGWTLWRAERERLMLSHPQSPLPLGSRDPGHAPRYFEYQPSWRRSARLEASDRRNVALPGSGSASVQAVRFAVARVDGLPPLSLFWLLDYAGGVFLSFRDATSGVSTYGGGRYLLDTAKGADLGGEQETLTLDFNFAYQPSCSYDAAWDCPLPPPENWLGAPVEAGERLG
jgi:uncharacterized protein